MVVSVSLLCEQTEENQTVTKESRFSLQTDPLENLAKMGSRVILAKLNGES